MKHLLIILLTLVFNGCSSSEENDFSANIVGNWYLVKIQTDKGLISPEPPRQAINNEIRIQFADSLINSVTGNTFMNSIWVKYSIEGREVSLFEFGGTRISEDFFGNYFKESLLKSTRFSIENGRLAFFDSKGNNILIFEKVKP